jgi:hypothetical protein
MAKAQQRAVETANAKHKILRPPQQFTPASKSYVTEKREFIFLDLGNKDIS